MEVVVSLELDEVAVSLELDEVAVSLEPDEVVESSNDVERVWVSADVDPEEELICEASELSMPPVLELVALVFVCDDSTLLSVPSGSASCPLHDT